MINGHMTGSILMLVIGAQLMCIGGQWPTHSRSQCLSLGQVYEGVLYRYKVVFLALRSHTGLPHTDGC